MPTTFDSADDFLHQSDRATVTADFFINELIGGARLSPPTPQTSRNRLSCLAYSFWQTQLSGKPVLELKVEINDRTYPVAGIMPLDFAYPTGAEIWAASRYRVPEPVRSPEDDPAVDRSNRYFHAVARLKQGETLDEAAAEGSAIISRFADENPDTEGGIHLRGDKSPRVCDGRRYGPC